jgi:hypothetical protein
MDGLKKRQTCMGLLRGDFEVGLVFFFEVDLIFCCVFECFRADSICPWPNKLPHPEIVHFSPKSPQKRHFHHQNAPKSAVFTPKSSQKRRFHLQIAQKTTFSAAATATHHASVSTTAVIVATVACRSQASWAAVAAAASPFAAPAAEMGGFLLVKSCFLLVKSCFLLVKSCFLVVKSCFFISEIVFLHSEIVFLHSEIVRLGLFLGGFGDQKWRISGWLLEGFEAFSLKIHRESQKK